MTGYRRLRKVSGERVGKHTKRMVVCINCNEGRNGYQLGSLCHKCGEKLVNFDSSGEWKQWLILRNAEMSGMISDLRRQVRLPLHAGNGEVVGHWVCDFVFKKGDDEVVYGDYKGRVMTDLAAWKLRHFEAEYGTEVIIFGGK